MRVNVQVTLIFWKGIKDQYFVHCNVKLSSSVFWFTSSQKTQFELLRLSGTEGVEFSFQQVVKVINGIHGLP